GGAGGAIGRGICAVGRWFERARRACTSGFARRTGGGAMSVTTATNPPVARRAPLDLMPELTQGFENLRAHKLRSILTMLGMIFGVAAVIAMLSIGAGAQQQVIAFIEQLGVRNVIVEAREAADNQALQQVRQISAGLTFADKRAIEATVGDISAASARDRKSTPLNSSHVKI